MGKSILGFAAALGAIQGARAFLDFAGEAVQSASDLEESTSKATVVFGTFFDEIEAFAATAPQALGLANAEALEFAGTFGNLFTALGLSQEAAAQLAPEIVQLGADLASFNNIEVTDALDKLRAGLVGEAEPLRALGVNLTAAATAAKAVELGLADSTTSVSEAAKVQARYALILEQTSNAQGDFARTSDSIANRQRSIAAEFENARAAIGEAPLPAFEALLDIAPALIQALQDGLVPAIASISTAIDSVDTSGLITTIAGLPSAANEVAQQTGNAFGVFFNTFQAGWDLVRGDLADASDNFAEVGDAFSQIGIDRQVSQSIQDLVETLATGRKPVLAFADVLGTLADTAIPDELLGDFALQLAAIAGVDIDDAASLLGLIEQFGDIGPGLGFTADQLDIVRTVLLDLSRGGIDPADQALLGLVNNLELVGPASQEAAGGVSVVAAAFQDLDQVKIDDIFGDITDQFTKLPSVLDAASAALETEEDEIVESFAGFLADLDGEIQKRDAFRDNLRLLRAFGLDTLADAFQAEGLNAATAASEAVDNIAGAIEANTALDEAAAAVAEDFTAQLFQDMAEAVANKTLNIASIEATIGNIRIGNIPAFDNLVIPATGSGLSGGNTTNITIENNVPQVDSTSSARTAQSINSLVNNFE
jgi:hypothetical protein